MLRPRIIPCLLVHERGLVKTVRFAEPKYVGDPLNAVRIFNEKQVDELIVLDIDATVRAAEPDYVMIEHLAEECRMPLCYGGGIRSVEQAQQIVGLGVEKLAVSAAAIADDGFVARLAARLGSQSVVVVLDVRRTVNGFEVWTHNGKCRTRWNPRELAARLVERGAGEIVVNAIDRDGTMQGYDLELVEAVHSAVAVPLTVLGGAGSLHHVQELLKKFGVIGAAAGSLFVFKGPYRAVLINYPRPV